MENDDPSEEDDQPEVERTHRFPPLIRCRLRFSTSVPQTLNCGMSE